MTIPNAITEYIEWKGSYAPAAATAYLSCLNKLGILTVPFERLEQCHVSRFLELHGRTLKPRTIVWYVNILKDFFGYYAGRTRVNPKLIRRPKFTPETPDFLTEDEFEQMDEYLEPSIFKDLQKKCMLRILWRTGIRVSELCDLKLSDIDTQNNYCRIITKKNKRVRWIMWNQEDHALLLRYIGVKICLDDSEALFPARSQAHHGKQSTRSVERMLDQLAKDAGLDRHVHPHMFRHGRAHYMLSHDANLNEVQEILGHTSIVSTQMYAKLLPNEVRRIASKYI